MSLATVEDALADIRAGRMVIVVDDEQRENEGDLILAAAKVTPEAITFMVRHGSGIICVPLEGERLEALDLPLMAPDNSETMRTAFTISVDARRGTTTGISARGRAISLAPDTSFPFATRRVESCGAPGTRRPPSILLASPGSCPRASCARS